MRAQAVVFTGPNQVSFQEVTCPEPGPAHAVVRVTHSWISNGTEGSFLRGERTAGDTPWRKGDPPPFPIVAGYQKVGVVTWVGNEIGDLTVGETVFATVGAVDGMFAPRGGQVSPSVMMRNGIWKLPEEHDPLKFSGLVLTQVGYNCGSRAPVGPGDGAVVIGDGLVGQWAAQTLRWRGADVLMVGRHTERLARFPRRELDPPGRTVNEHEGDWTAAVKEAFPKGVQVAVDTVGSVPAMEATVPLMRRHGHLVSAGFYGTEDRMPLQPPRHGELSIDLVSGWTTERMDRTLDLVAEGVLETLPLITHRFPAERAAEAWATIRSKRDGAMGVILEWEK